MGAEDIVMELDDLQRDALGELFNIGVGRAANALSQIVSSEVMLSVPNVDLVTVSAVKEMLVKNEFRHFSTVSQYFEGPFNAEAVLIFPESNALVIVSHMLGHQLAPEELSEYEQEAMCEVGNIILNACISALADLFCVEFNGGLPHHQFNDSEKLGFHLGQDSDYVLILQVKMLINRENIAGQMLYLLGLQSLTSLLNHLDQYLIEQGLK